MVSVLVGSGVVVVAGPASAAAQSGRRIVHRPAADSEIHDLAAVGR
jgi:hypothetical protein